MALPDLDSGEANRVDKDCRADSRDVVVSIKVRHQSHWQRQKPAQTPSLVWRQRYKVALRPLEQALRGSLPALTILTVVVFSLSFENS